MDNLTEETINKFQNKITIIDAISIITGFISFYAVYSWLYSWSPTLSLIIALIPACLFAWAHDLLNDLRRFLNNIK